MAKHRWRDAQREDLTPEPMERVIEYELDLLRSHGIAAVVYPPKLTMVESVLFHPDFLLNRIVNREGGIRALTAIGNPEGIERRNSDNKPARRMAKYL